MEPVNVPQFRSHYGDQEQGTLVSCPIAYRIHLIIHTFILTIKSSNSPHTLPLPLLESPHKNLPTTLPRTEILASSRINRLPPRIITSIQSIINSYISPPLWNRNIRQRNREEDYDC